MQRCASQFRQFMAPLAGSVPAVISFASFDFVQFNAVDKEIYTLLIVRLVEYISGRVIYISH